MAAAREEGTAVSPRGADVTMRPFRRRMPTARPRPAIAMAIRSGFSGRTRTTAGPHQPPMREPMASRRIAAAGAALAVPDQDFDETLERVVKSVTAAAPCAIQTIRRMMDRMKDGGVSAQHDDIDEIITEVRQGPDAREGVAANRERRVARFQHF